MASEKVIRILKAGGAPFSEKEMLMMNDRDGWAWIYKNRPPTKPKDKREQICFTGQTDYEKEGLFQKAINAGLKPVMSVTKRLKYLCVGENVGPTKLKKAQEQEVRVITTKEFLEIFDK